MHANAHPVLGQEQVSDLCEKPPTTVTGIFKNSVQLTFLLVSVINFRGKADQIH